ncbi:hypothetical protein BUALT_BualtUnG0001100 [Buddleja alternifolia]|uniref:HAT C-terminal dimerisation domain-containing protein n=1 Tax=Buddleja alternifolia TaxID=168488 RepID=A0AAV6W0S9_9LAMI|nr:hypothetical protein BUALT_BualtUnG0001100 [Buddleja alternifolia]
MTFLETFHDATNILSGTQFCTKNVFFREVYRILVLLCENSNDQSTLLGAERVEKELHALFNEYLALYEISHRRKECYGKDKEFSEEEDAIGNKSELEVYLEEKLHPSKNNDNFDILQYWKNNESKFPVLSRMAKDILSIPVSSVASESAFCTGERVLSKFRSSLLPSTVEALTCAQDWIRSGPVHIGYDEEFDTSFSALHISKTS